MRVWEAAMCSCVVFMINVMCATQSSSAGQLVGVHLRQSKEVREKTRVIVEVAIVRRHPRGWQDGVVVGYLRVDKIEIPLLVVTNNLSENIFESPVRDLDLTIGLGMVRRGEAELGAIHLVELPSQSVGKARVTIGYDAHRDPEAYWNDRESAIKIKEDGEKATQCSDMEEGQAATEMSKNRLLRRAQVYTSSWLGGAEGGLSTALAGKLNVVAIKDSGVRASRGGMTFLAAAQTPTPTQNDLALLSGKDTARRDKALREVLLRDLGGRRAGMTRTAACPREGGEGKLEALSYREGRVLQVVVDNLAEVEVVAMVTLRRHRDNNVLLSILECAKAVREVAALLRGTAGTTVERGMTLGTAVREGGGVTSTLRLRGGSGLKTGPHPLMGPGGLVSLRGRCEVILP
ncbi:hypothetical protein CBR_g52371 [Chara braunii]|uniref:Uncharacterized protein n=1 Tax=Chara braunii TaxID=69332 RepID=A0A388K6V0_CHABU|nr:hypothetical protein CBR_g52371 [Chara braunii]|eukprot:GBG65780.1 hypothetical protein CBR_g52371 [Chara braunii]